MTTLLMLAFGCWLVRTLIRTGQEAEVRKKDPDAWMRLREIEREKRRMRNENVKNSLGIGAEIARSLMKR